MATVDEEEHAMLDRLTFDYHQKLQGKPQSHELVGAGHPMPPALPGPGPPWVPSPVKRVWCGTAPWLCSSSELLLTQHPSHPPNSILRFC